MNLSGWWVFLQSSIICCHCFQFKRAPKDHISFGNWENRVHNRANKKKSSLKKQIFRTAKLLKILGSDLLKSFETTAAMGTIEDAMGRILCLIVSTTPVTAMGCWQCLPHSVVQLKGKHGRKPHCHNGVVYTFGL